MQVMTSKRARLLAFLVVVALTDIGLSLRATLTRSSRPLPTSGVAATGAPRPTVASLGEVLGWVTSFMLVLLIAMVITDGVWVRRAAQQNTPPNLQPNR
jgi:hypothetical protein